MLVLLSIPIKNKETEQEGIINPNKVYIIFLNNEIPAIPSLVTLH